MSLQGQSLPSPCPTLARPCQRAVTPAPCSASRPLHTASALRHAILRRTRPDHTPAHQTQKSTFVTKEHRLLFAPPCPTAAREPPISQAFTLPMRHACTLPAYPRAQPSPWPSGRSTSRKHARLPPLAPTPSPAHTLHAPSSCTIYPATFLLPAPCTRLPAPSTQLLHNAHCLPVAALQQTACAPCLLLHALGRCGECNETPTQHRLGYQKPQVRSARPPPSPHLQLHLQLSSPS
ncbi:hypothetical protein T484DRAFT_1976162 [Baffinella frigidus]|nr:hypothetical protein T484DRAFT_1976162 [Cryptophyta sp. CCMP2293]